MKEPRLSSTIHMSAKLRNRVDKARGKKISLRAAIEEGLELWLKKQGGQGRC